MRPEAEPERPRIRSGGPRFRTLAVNGPLCLVVRGPLGAGKTTVARLVGRRLGAKVVSVDHVLERHELEVWDTARDCVALSSFLRANALIVRSVRGQLRAGRPVVIEGNFYWREAVTDLRRRVGRSVLVVRLDAPLTVCLQRDRGRPAPEPGRTPRAGQRMGSTAVRKVFRYVSEIRAGAPIDARGSVDEVVERIFRRFARQEGVHGARAAYPRTPDARAPRKRARAGGAVRGERNRDPRAGTPRHRPRSPGA